MGKNQYMILHMVLFLVTMAHAQEDAVWLEKGKIHWSQSAQPSMQLSVETAWGDLLSEGKYRCPLSDFKSGEPGVIAFQIDDNGALDGKLIMTYEREDVVLSITLANGYYHGEVTGTKAGIPIHQAVFEQGELVQETTYSPQGVAIFEESKKDFSWVQRDTTEALIARQYVLLQHDTLLVVKERYRAGRLVEKHTTAQRSTASAIRSEYAYTEIAHYNHQGKLQRVTISRPKDKSVRTPYHEEKVFNAEGLLVQEEKKSLDARGLVRILKRRLVNGEWEEAVVENQPDVFSMEDVVNETDR